MNEAKLEQILDNISRLNSRVSQLEESDPDLKQRVLELEKRERTITECIKEFNQTQQKILRLLKGDSFSDSQGLGKRMTKAEQNIDDLEELIQKAKWWFTGASFVGPTLGGIIMYLIFNFVFV